MIQPVEIEMPRAPRWARALPFLAGAPELSRRQWAVLGLVSVASLFDQYDRSLMAMALPQIQASLGIPEASVGVFASIVRLGSLPALFIALAADRIGRRRALLGTVMAYTALTGATAFAPDPYTYIGLQFLSRVFGTAEMLLAVVVISEELDAESRGWGIGAFLAIQACGVGLVSILLPIAGSFPNGWRGLYLVGLGPLLLLAWLRRSLPETPRFEARQRVLVEQHRARGLPRPDAPPDPRLSRAASRRCRCSSSSVRSATRPRTSSAPSTCRKATAGPRAR